MKNHCVTTVWYLSGTSMNLSISSRSMHSWMTLTNSVLCVCGSISALDNALRPDTWLSPTPKRRIALAPDTKGETEVTFGGRVFRLSANARRTLHLLLEEDGLSFGALAEKLATTVEDNGLREAVAQLVAKGLVAVESDETPTYCRKGIPLAVGRLEDRSLVVAAPSGVRIACLFGPVAAKALRGVTTGSRLVGEDEEQDSGEPQARCPTGGNRLRLP